MPRKALTEDTKKQIDTFLSSLYLDVQGATATSGTTKMTEEYIIKLLTRFLISLGTAFWSITELIDYIRNRREFREFTH